MIVPLYNVFYSIIGCSLEFNTAICCDFQSSARPTQYVTAHFCVKMSRVSGFELEGASINWCALLKVKA